MGDEMADLSLVQNALPVAAERTKQRHRRRRPTAVQHLFAWAPVLLGSGLFVVAWANRSFTLTNVAAGVATGGLAWVPVAMALQQRLASISRAKLMLGFVLILQGMHTVEHIVQITESYRLDRPPVLSLGIVSKLNVEWVHFTWNWLAWAGVIVALLLGARSWALGILIAWITAHSLEHTYMLWRYLRVTRELDRLGVARLGSSEVLPGILGRDGWLSLHASGLRGVLGPLTAAPRVAIHLWWNVGEVVLLAAACASTNKSTRERQARITPRRNSR